MTLVNPYDPSLPYAAVAPPRTGTPWAGAAIIIGGLGLIGLGGCFLIGVLLIVSPQVFLPNAQPPDLTGPQAVLMIFLYVLAFSCFAGAAVMLYVGTRALLRVLGHR